MRLKNLLNNIKEIYGIKKKINRYMFKKATYKNAYKNAEKDCKNIRMLF